MAAERPRALRAEGPVDEAAHGLASPIGKAHADRALFSQPVAKLSCPVDRVDEGRERGKRLRRWDGAREGIHARAQLDDQRLERRGRLDLSRAERTVAFDTDRCLVLFAHNGTHAPTEQPHEQCLCARTRVAARGSGSLGSHAACAPRLAEPPSASVCICPQQEFGIVRQWINHSGCRRPRLPVALTLTCTTPSASEKNDLSSFSTLAPGSFVLSCL